MEEPQTKFSNTPSRSDLGRLIRRTFGRLILAILFALLPLLGLLVKSGLASARAWWSRHQAARTAEHPAGEPNSAAAPDASSILAALRTSPDDPTMMRAWATWLDKNNGPAGDRVPAWRQVVNSEHGTPHDRAKLARALIDDRKHAEARTIIEALPEKEAASTEILEARALLMDAAGDRQAGDELRKKAWQGEADNPESRFKLAQLQLGEFYEENRRQALKTLWELARTSHAAALKAMEVLSAHESLSRMQAEELLALADKHPKADKRQHFLALTGVLKTHPETRQEIIQTEVAKSTSYGPEDLVNLGLMLDQAGAWPQLLVAIPESKALLQRELCLLRIKALSESGSFSELQSMLRKRSDLPLSKGYKLLLAAHIELKKGEVNGAMNMLLLALKRAVADSDIESVHRVAIMAEGQGWWDLAVQSHDWMASSGNADSLESLKRLFQAAANKRDAALMLSAIERMTEARDDRLQTLTTQAYLRLLLGSRIETVSTILDEILARRSGSKAADETCGTFLKAFLCYRYGDKDGMRENISGISDWSLIQPGQRAISAALLQLSGRESLARDLAWTLRSPALLAEEHEFWTAAQQQAVAGLDHAGNLPQDESIKGQQADRVPELHPGQFSKKFSR